MNPEQILNSNLSKAEKARRLYDAGFTRHQVADLICSGNYGWAHNIYKKHFGLETVRRAVVAAGFNHKFGIELEAYNVCRHTLSAALNAAGILCHVEGYNHTTRNHWKIVGDGSLSGANAFEIVSPVLQGEAGMIQAETVCRVLEAQGAKINKSCGFHVHFDARTFSMADWKNLYSNYIALESEIDAMLPASRRNNQYCRSVSHRFPSKAAATEALQAATTVQELSRIIAGSNRYMKLNAESYMRHGTVEFRQHSGTVEFQKVGSWVRICAAMIDKSKQGMIATLNDCLTPELQTYVATRKRKFATA